MWYKYHSSFTASFAKNVEINKQTFFCSLNLSTLSGVEHWSDSVYDKHVNQNPIRIIVIALSMCDPINLLVYNRNGPCCSYSSGSHSSKLQSLPSWCKFTEMFRGFSYQLTIDCHKLCTKCSKSYREEISKTKFFVRTFVCRREHVIALALQFIACWPKTSHSYAAFSLNFTDYYFRS